MTWTSLNDKCFCPQWIIYYVHAEPFLHEWKCLREIESFCAADLQLHVSSRDFSHILQADREKKNILQAELSLSK